MENQKVDPYKYAEFIFDKSTKAIKWQTVFSTNGAGTNKHPCSKNVSLDLKLMPYTKISSKEIVGVNVKCKNTNILGKRGEKALI